MTGNAVRWLVRAHALLAWAATLSLVLAAIAARSRRFARASVVIAAALTSLAFASGLGLEAPWRVTKRVQVFVRAAALGWWMERKEHLAFGALALVWAAFFLHVASSTPKDDGAVSPLRIASSRSLIAAALLAVVATCAGAWVAHRFPM